MLLVRLSTVAIIGLMSVRGAFAAGYYTAPCTQEHEAMLTSLGRLTTCLEQSAYKKPATTTKSAEIQKPCPQQNDAFAAAQLKFAQCTQEKPNEK